MASDALGKYGFMLPKDDDLQAHNDETGNIKNQWIINKKKLHNF